jgi:MFS family permease
VSEPSTERRTLRRNLRELPRPAWVLVAGTFVNWFASFAITFLTLFLTSRGFTAVQAGAALAAYGGGELAAGALGGHLADRLGRRTTMVVSMLASAATIMGLYYAQAYAAILAVAFLAGVATETWRPASRALMADLVPQGQRVTAFAMIRFSGNLAFAIGGAVAGLLADRSFLWLYALDAGTSVLFALITLVALPAGRRTSRSEDRERGGYRAIWGDRAFMLFIAASVLLVFVYSQQQATLPLQVVNVSGLSRSSFGWMLAFNGLLVVLLELPISSLTMRRAPREMTALGFFLVGVGFGLTAFADALPAFLVTVGVWTLGEMVAAPVSYAYVADLAPEHLRGRYQGIYGLAWGVGGVAGPAVGTAIFAQTHTGFWFLCGGLGFASALLALGSRPRGRHRVGHHSEAGAEPI